MGVTSQVLDIHDGELLPTLEHRKLITKLIREWRADIVIAHRPWDYHPDHRYVGVLVQDAAFMVTVPFFCPDVPPLEKNPVFLYASDGFRKPYPFQADVAVSVDDVFQTKLDAIHELPRKPTREGAMAAKSTPAACPRNRSPKAQSVAQGTLVRSRQSAEAHRSADVLTQAGTAKNEAKR